MGHSGRIWSLARAPGTNTIASAGQDGTVRLWDGKGAREFLKFGPAITGAVGFADGGRTVLVLDGNNTWSIARWSARTGEIKLTFFQMSPSDRYVMFVRHLTAPHSLIWDRQLRRLVSLPRDDVHWIVFAASGEPILAVSTGDLIWWDPETGRMSTHRMDSRVPNRAARFSPDGRLISVIVPGERTCFLVSAQTLELVREIPPQPAEIKSAVFSPDGKTLALISDDRVIRLLSTASGEELIGIEGLGQKIYLAQFAPDCKTFLTASTAEQDQPPEYRLWPAAADVR
jgi:WD40 repeat protein